MSARAASSGSAAPATWCAAVREKLPANTDSTASARCSRAVSSCHERSKVARTLRCSGRSSPSSAASSTSTERASSASISATGSSRTQLAASRIASGSPPVARTREPIDRRLRRRIEVRAHGACRRNEQLRRGRPEHRFGVRGRRRQRQAGQRQQPLAAHAQAHARGGAHAQPRRALEQPLEQARQLGQMLGVVEHQQRLALGQVLGHLRERRLRPSRRQPQLDGQARGHLGRVVQVVERDPVRAVGEARLHLPQRLLGQAALADAARPAERQHPAGVELQQAGELVQRLLAPDQAARRRRRLRRRPGGRGRLRGRAIGQQPPYAMRRLDAQLFLQPQRVGAIGGALLVDAAQRAQRREQRDRGVFVERVVLEQPAGERRGVGRRIGQPGQPADRDRPHAALVRRALPTSQSVQPASAGSSMPSSSSPAAAMASASSARPSRAARSKSSTSVATCQRTEPPCTSSPAAQGSPRARCSALRTLAADRSPVAPGQNSAASSSRPTQPRRSASTDSSR